jgi:hypothetical protein
MDIACRQTALELNCSYRVLAGGDLESATAEWQGQLVDGRIVERYPGADDTTALMILVDTSDPARQAAVAKAAREIDVLLRSAPAHYRFALASFDTDLYRLAPLGASPAEIRRAAAGLTASGRTTELYRNVREAVRLLALSTASRKGLLIMSDGLAEDYAYGHEDVVALAREHGVVINSIGYPRSVAQSVALQTLRRLADETGGIYVQANHVDFSIPDGIFGRMLATLDSGGELAFDLAPLAAAGATGMLELPLAFQTSEQSFIVLAPVALPAAADTSARAPVAASPPDTAAGAPPPAQPAAVATLPAPAVVPARPLWLSFGVLLGLLVLILAVVLGVLQRLRRAAPGSIGDPRGKPLAWLVMHDPKQTRHVIDKTPWRIGRGRNNDLTLTDHSVSRLHAEIRRNEEGVLTLNDLESLNGVFVNDNRVESIQLREGDTVDIGDVRMTFTLHDEGYAAQESTVLIPTRMP